jgi:lipoate-protein ligase B
VALNVDVDLDFHSQVPPCNLEGIMPTSLHNEGVNLMQKSVNSKMIQLITESFQDAV